MFEFNSKDRPTLLFGAALCGLTLAAAMFIFDRIKTDRSAEVEKSSSEPRNAKRLILRKDEITAAYQRLSVQGVHSMGDWVKKLTELSKKEGIVFDSIEPVSETGDAGNFAAVLKFRTNLRGFSGFVSALVMEDYLTAAEGFSIEQAGEGLLNCELTLRRALS